MKISKLVKRYRVGNPKKFRISDIDPADTCDLDFDKDDAKEMLAESTKRLADLQELLYAQDQWAVLVIFQAMDAAGKDGVIKHVMSGVNPQGCEVHPFKVPTAHELDHDFMWRAAVRLPERGHIGIFNRSYYEEVLVVRVHPEFLERQKLPKELIGKDIWDQRYKTIRAFERHVSQNGTKILKFHLRVSKEEQRQRFLDRLEEPTKRWKFNMGDVAERKLWDKYMDAYEVMIRETSTDEAPWHVIPADNKYLARLAVSAAIVEVMEDLHLSAPKVKNSPELEQVKQALLNEGGAPLKPKKKKAEDSV
ncbi:MAG TPA: polyphosphate kinase 2 family protein [Xanthobacteraceae bacterium]|nr:polyphosphate kinase 2 family protein [Xanthobacteraceae bacterium]